MILLSMRTLLDYIGITVLLSYNIKCVAYSALFALVDSKNEGRVFPGYIYSVCLFQLHAIDTRMRTGL